MELSGGGKQRSLGNRTSFPIALGVFPECLRFQLPCPGLEGRATDCVPWSAQADAVSTARERTHARTHTHTTLSGQLLNAQRVLHATPALTSKHTTAIHTAF